jgi:hypothetical protein
MMQHRSGLPLNHVCLWCILCCYFSRVARWSAGCGALATEPQWTGGTATGQFCVWGVVMDWSVSWIGEAWD